MKNIVVALEERFARDASGDIYSRVFNDDFWSRYLMAFDRVTVFARVMDVDDASAYAENEVISDSRITFVEVPYYHGAKGFLSVLPSLLRVANRVARTNERFILRLPGVIGSLLFLLIFLRRKPFGVELVGDPYVVFSEGGAGGFFRVFYRGIFSFLTRMAVSKASAVSYVTKETMQVCYPASPDAFTTYYSSIVLPSSLLVSEKDIRSYSEGTPFFLLAVGSMEQPYKGFDILIEAFRIVAQTLPSIRLTLVGDGILRSSLEAQATSLGVRDRVCFSGLLSRDRVLMHMDRADVMVTPSRTEGIPRVLIEAFARGVPCVASNAGGIPELLEEVDTFEAGSVDGLVDLLLRVVPDHSQRMIMSRRNILFAHQFESDVLCQRRQRFYKAVYDAT